MDIKGAEILLDETFNRNYDVTSFQNFIQELFNGFKTVPSTRPGSGIYEDYVEKYTVLGEYKDPAKYKIDVLSVKLKRTSSRDRARTMQRNFIAKHLTDSNKDAALVAFYGDDPDDWRFSFVKMEYGLNAGAATVKTATPVKRYSYLVGTHEPNHTCRSQFVNLLIEDTKNPSLENIEDAFSIEKVTKEFFELYKQRFLELKESIDAVLEKDGEVKADFEQKGISTTDFAKKLLGQIVFIYFLQKKGWLGVGKDAETGKFKEWGTGSKSFLRDLYEKKVVPYDNFFNDILEPLFYEALSTERDKHYYSRFNCKIPFLNGGLFEPMSDYNWQESELLIDNSVFKEILDTFDKFNFTVKEDEPLEKEVAVDPEMLGKVFENLLEVKDRKSKGAFYTPREIVHYMCQQSLINYLETNTKEIGISREDIEIFMHFSDFSSSDDQKLLAEIAEHSEKIKSGDLKNLGKLEKELLECIEKINLPKSILRNKERIDSLLANIKVVDPAVGSGAFPVGMMNEIIKARSVLSIFINNNEKETRKTLYDLKRETIENCLYGVDIDSSAVDITKLRFWLSLVVDENDITNIKPLPNLDHKIMCGNSLLEEFEGIKLFDEKILAKTETTPNLEIRQIDSKMEDLNQQLHDIHTGKIKDFSKLETVKKEISKLEKQKKRIQLSPEQMTQQIDLNNLEMIENYKISESKRKIRDIKKLHKKYFDENNKVVKDKLIKQIDELEWGLIEETLKESGNEDSILKLKQYKKTKSKPFFLWKLYFADVFERENPGFDVVIGNPPYVKEYTNKNIFDGLRRSAYYQGKMDLWYFFGCIGIDSLREDGIECYIAPNNWISNAGASIFRNKIVDECQILKFIDFGNYKIFTAGIQTMVFILRKNDQSDNYNIAYSKLRRDNINSNELSTFLYATEYSDYFFKYTVGFKRSFFKNRYITFHSEKIGTVLTKIKSVGDIYLDKSETAQGVVTPQDSLNKENADKLDNQSKIGDGIFILSDCEKRNICFDVKELELIKPYYTTNELHKYFASDINHYWLIYTKSDINKNIFQYPRIKAHLDKYREIITSDYKPYGLHRARDENFFTGESIVSLRKCSEPTFTYCAFDCYVSQTFIIIKTNRINLKYLTGVLNSQLIKFWLYYEGKLQGNNYQVDSEPLMNIPLRIASSTVEKPIIAAVDKILSISNRSDYFENAEAQAKVQALQKEIDQLVYQLYELTPEEIEIVVNFNSDT